VPSAPPAAIASVDQSRAEELTSILREVSILRETTATSCHLMVASCQLHMIFLFPMLSTSLISLFPMLSTSSLTAEMTVCLRVSLFPMLSTSSLAQSVVWKTSPAAVSVVFDLQKRDGVRLLSTLSTLSSHHPQNQRMPLPYGWQGVSSQRVLSAVPVLRSPPVLSAVPVLRSPPVDV